MRTDHKRSSVIRRIEDLIQALERTIIFEREFFQNVVWIIVSTDETDWRECIDVMPAALRQKLGVFAKSYLLPVDFMPDAAHFVASGTPADHDAKKRELRPQYIKLLALIDETPALAAESFLPHD